MDSLVLALALALGQETVTDIEVVAVLVIIVATAVDIVPGLPGVMTAETVTMVGIVMKEETKAEMKKKEKETVIVTVKMAITVVESNNHFK